MISEHFFSDRTQLFSALLDDCSRVLRKAIEIRGAASLLASGGNSPQPLYQQLSSVELDWTKVDVALVDERWVDNDHAGSNEAFIQKNLLVNNASEANFIAMKTTDESATLGQQECEQRYQTLTKPFDLTLLGMGSDAHTASLFPQAKGLVSAFDCDNKNLCVAIDANRSEVTGELTERMSLSLYGLMQSQQLHLLIMGEAKLAVYQQALVSTNVEQTPVSALLQQDKVPVNIYWAP